MRVIADRLREGYTADELMLFARKFAGKRRAHRWHQQHQGEDPPINSKHWCPNVNWAPDEAYGPERFGRYHAAWQAEEVITAESLQRERERLLYGDLS